MMQTIRRVVLTAAAATALAAPAIAVDGVLEINQACVATGCFPGDFPGFPVQITSFGGAEGSYRLTSNLVVPDDDTTAISVLLSAVVIDLNGFTIRGQYQCGTTPPNCPGGSARAIDGSNQFVAVLNGRVTRFGDDGVVLGSGRVVGLTVDRIGGDGIVVSNGLIRDNVVQAVQGDGIQVGSTALLLGNSVSGAGGQDAQLGVGVGYGHNVFTQAPAGGTSMGDNVCGGVLC